ncbi:hypothetical protein [Sphingomonas faeni]|uniref:hypothetical protein n=1 Tax=Sphingomonas faeni TaxID=185950 RepID=UPI0020BDE252|nr:hypothetical protein [Sphingomonas faeni]
MLLIAQHYRIQSILYTTKQQIIDLAVIASMTYSFLTISREAEGQHVVRRPRPTDVIGTSLRDAFGPQPRLPEDMERLLRSLDGAKIRHH